MQAFEIELIEEAMQAARHNQRKAAELLSLTYHQLRGYLKKYELLKQEGDDKPSSRGKSASTRKAASEESAQSA